MKNFFTYNITPLNENSSDCGVHVFVCKVINATTIGCRGGGGGGGVCPRDGRVDCIWRNGPYIGGHHAFIFKLNFKHIYNLL